MNAIVVAIIVFIMFGGTYIILKLPILKRSSFVIIKTKLFEIVIKK